MPALVFSWGIHARSKVSQIKHRESSRRSRATSVQVTREKKTLRR